MKKKFLVGITLLFLAQPALAETCSGSVARTGCTGCFFGGLIGWGSYKTTSWTDTYVTVNGTCVVRSGTVKYGVCGSC